MKRSPFKFQIGRGKWADAIRRGTADIDAKYWAKFAPVRTEEIAATERELNRSFPADYRSFLLEFGAGRFPDPFGGGIDHPSEIECLGPLWMLLGCSDWAPHEEQRRFYATRGAFNPAPDLFTPQAILHEGDNLLDFLQIGDNGACCYHQLNLNLNCNFGYCLLTPEGTKDDKQPSFSEGLRHILTHHWKQARGLDAEEEELACLPKPTRKHAARPARLPKGQRCFLLLAVYPVDRQEFKETSELMLFGPSFAEEKADTKPEVSTEEFLRKTKHVARAFIVPGTEGTECVLKVQRFLTKRGMPPISVVPIRVADEAIRPPIFPRDPLFVLDAKVNPLRLVQSLATEIQGLYSAAK